jgi:hypothetical protein
MKRTSLPILMAALALGSSNARAATVEFASRELFHIPFGKENNMLGARIEGGNFLVPRDFTMDGAGHFYIYDSNNHRIVRFSSAGAYEMGIRYPTTARQVFAHADARENLWLLISDPERGLYYGVYDLHGKRIHEGIFSQFDTYRLHVDDDYTLHVIVSNSKTPAVTQTYLLDQESLLMKKENVARPPEDHHQVKKSDRVYFIDPIPGSAKDDAHRQMQITDEKHQAVASIKGTVVYVTEDGEVYARVGEREIDVYDVSGSLKGKVILEGLPAACAAVRFDSTGNIYELDGIPDSDQKYSASMPGMRLILWERR